MSFDTTVNKIKKAIDTFSMFRKGDSVLVGFSGGKDSVVLLHALNSLASFYGITLTALHVNHNIRGDEAMHDQQFCKEFCEKNNIPFVCASVDAVTFSENNKVGLEEGARILRYDAFYNTCRELGISKIATAHTASDNLETVLFNLARGSASTGMKGIPPVRDNIVRPLIYCTTDEVIEYAQCLGLTFVTDSTNADTDYSRNHIRHSIVPLLKNINPALENAVSNMCDALRCDLSYILSCTDKIDTDKTDELAVLHPALLSRVLINMYRSVSGQTLESVHISEMTDLVYNYSKNRCRDVKQLSLPGKTDMVVTPCRIYFKKHIPSSRLQEHVLTFGLNEFPETGCALYIADNEQEVIDFLNKNIYKISIHTIVKKSALTDTIVRGRIDGDTFSFSNMTKKVKKMFNEAKIPTDMRDILPIICDKDGIVWIAGFPLRDDAKPDGAQGSAHIYYLTQGENV